MTSQPQPDRASAVGAAQTLADALNGVSVRLDDVKAASEDRDEKLKRYGRHNRGFIYADIALTIVIACLAFWVNSAASNAASASNQAAAANVKAAAASAAAAAQRAASVAGCEQGNTYRAGTVASLDRLVTLLVGPHPTAAVRQEAVEYEKYVLAHNEPRNCQKAYPAPKAVAGGK